MMKQLTPVLTVDAIEPCLEFWLERLGFTKTVEVPEGDRLGFVILERDGVEVMYQTKASVEEDIPELADDRLRGSSVLFLEIESADWAAERLEGAEHVIPRRTTFYGADEHVVRAPCGTVVILAEITGEE